MKLFDYFRFSMGLEQDPTPAQAVYWLWVYFSRMIERERSAAGFDLNGMFYILAAKSDPNTPAAELAKIQAVFDWINQSWLVYGELRKQAAAGENIALPEKLPQPCPYSFGNLFVE